MSVVKGPGGKKKQDLKKNRLGRHKREGGGRERAQNRGARIKTKNIGQKYKRGQEVSGFCPDQQRQRGSEENGGQRMLKGNPISENGRGRKAQESRQREANSVIKCIGCRVDNRGKNRGKPLLEQKKEGKAGTENAIKQGRTGKVRNKTDISGICKVNRNK